MAMPPKPITYLLTLAAYAASLTHAAALPPSATPPHTAAPPSKNKGPNFPPGTSVTAKCEYYLAHYQVGPAIKLLEQGVRSKQIDPRQYFRLKVEALLLAGQKQEAARCLDLGLSQFPDDAGLYYARSKVYYDTKNPKASIRALNKAIELDPKMAPAYLDRARANFIMSENLFGEDLLKKAKEDINKALALDPNLAEAYHSKGVWLSLEQHNKEAIQYFSKAIELGKKNHTYYIHRANSYNSIGDSTSALKDLNEAVAIKPRDKSVHMDRAKLLTQMKKYDDALKDYLDALKIDPKSTTVRSEMTVLYQKMGRYNEAVDEYTRIIKASPLDDEAYQSRGKCYQAMKKFDLALSDFNEAIELSPDLPSHYEARAKLYKVMNKVELYNKDSLMAQNLREKKP